MCYGFGKIKTYNERTRTAYFTDLRRFMVLCGLSDNFVLASGWQYSQDRLDWLVKQTGSYRLELNDKDTRLHAVSSDYLEYTLVSQRKPQLKFRPKFVTPESLSGSVPALVNTFEQNWSRLVTTFASMSSFETNQLQKVRPGEYNIPNFELVKAMGFIERGSKGAYLNVEKLRNYVDGIVGYMFVGTADVRTQKIIEATPVIATKRSWVHSIVRWLGDRLLGYPFEDHSPMITRDIAAKTRLMGLTGNQVESVVNRDANREAIRCSWRTGVTSPYYYYRSPISELDANSKVVPCVCRYCARNSDCSDLRNHVLRNVHPRNGLGIIAVSDMQRVVTDIAQLVNHEGYVFYV